jgi:hypothetical protein
MSETLPTAQDIARERTKDLPTETIEQRLSKAAAFMVETQKAKRELSRGEWKRDV